MEKVQVKQPEYFSKFKCTMGECRSNCCKHNWQIRIDKKTYDKYVSLKSEIGDEFLNNIRVITEDPFLAIIAPNEGKGCRFLDDKGLCSIQLSLGYNYLCRTCIMHPRSISYIDGKWETYLEPSCEEVVRIVLFDEKPIKLVDAILEPDGCGDYIPNKMLDTSKYIKSLDAVRIFYSLRNAAVEIIQNRKYTLRVRMLFLCLFIQQASDLIEQNKEFEMIVFVDSFLQSFKAGDFDSIADEIPNGVENDFTLVLDILRDIEAKGGKRFNASLLQTFTALNVPSEDNILSDEFCDNYKIIYNDFLSDKEYIFENYLVNSMLMEGFPFNYLKENSILENYASLLAKYNLIEFLIVGVTAFHEEVNEIAIIDVVSAFSRCYDHSLKRYI
ncbi:MAG: flagellin lysine-N-methylase [Oscillospiraceae bacterium]|jgi:lysine-N-methylase|nr:flagellin lysine-N-methylase [Oscillospiraceae bacterium]